MKTPAVSSLKFRLQPETIKSIEKTTRCSVEELRNLSHDEVKKLMIERGSLKEPSKIKQWFAQKYQQFGEKFGLLKKEYNIYTDID